MRTHTSLLQEGDDKAYAVMVLYNPTQTHTNVVKAIEIY